VGHRNPSKTRHVQMSKSSRKPGKDIGFENEMLLALRI
jgi:hypothetical protein